MNCIPNKIRDARDIGLAGYPAKILNLHLNDGLSKISCGSSTFHYIPIAFCAPKKCLTVIKGFFLQFSQRIGRPFFNYTSWQISSLMALLACPSRSARPPSLLQPQLSVPQTWLDGPLDCATALIPLAKVSWPPSLVQPQSWVPWPQLDAPQPDLTLPISQYQQCHTTKKRNKGLEVSS